MFSLKIGLISLHSFLKPGGVKVHTKALQKEFQKRGCSSKIIIPRRFKSEKYGKTTIFFGKSVPIPFNGSEGDLSFSLYPLIFQKILNREKFNVLHFHNFGLLTFQILTYLKSRPQTVNIFTLHSNFDFQKSKIFKAFPYFLKIFNNLVAKKIDGIIGIAPFNLKFFKDYPGPKVVIPNGIDLKKFNPDGKKIEKYSDNKINLLFIGRIEERKGLIYLLRAYQILKKKFKNLRLIIVGEGKLKTESQNFVKSHQLRDVTFEGEINEEKIPSYYRSCDIFISPAIFGESFGLVLLEAMATGKPVVGFSNQAYKIVLKGKGENFLAKPRDWRGLTKKIEILIKNESKRLKMGKWGRRKAQNYSWEKIASKVLTFYQKVAAQKFK